MAFARTVRVLGATALAAALILATAPAASADQTRRDQWALDTLQAESAWKISQGQGVTVAVIDSGVNSTHEDLTNNVLKGYDFVDNDDDATPGEDDSEPDHGTAMASVIAGHGHGQGGADGVMGLAPEAKILPIREGGGAGFSEEIRYAVDHGASVINMSISTTLQSTADREAVEYALKHNVLIVTASGNSGRGDVVDYPKKYPGVLTVGGVDRDGQIWDKSDYGPEVLLTAPATRIVGASWPDNKLRMGSGTSDSAAFVSGAAALLRAKFPDLTAGQIANRLAKTAVLPDSAKGISLPDEKYGYGAIRPLAALTEDIPAGSKYGPLKDPESGSEAAAGTGKSDADYAAETENTDTRQMLFLAVLGLIVLAVLALIVLLIVKQFRPNRNNNGGPGGPAAYPSYGQQPVPPQQNPYQQPVPPQHNPYQQQYTPPSNQWPPHQ